MEHEHTESGYPCPADACDNPGCWPDDPMADDPAYIAHCEASEAEERAAHPESFYGPDGDGDDPAPGVGIPAAAEREARAKQEEALAAKDRQNAAESWERSDTDGFLSQWASGLSANMHSAQAEIERAGGLAEFDAIFTVAGEWVPSKTFEGRWGTRWMILDEEGRAIGIFLPFKPARRSTLAKKGYVEGRVLRPAKARITGSGHGLSGSAWVAVFPADKDTDRPAKILCRDRWKEEEDIAHDKEITQAAGSNNPTE